MHELSLCESILQIIEQQAEAHEFTRVNKVWLEVGGLSCVEPEAMHFSFDAVMKNTVAEGAVLEIIEVPGLAWCKSCEKNVQIKQRYEPCPVCGDMALELKAGDQTRLKELEVE